jgi:hypothetical protein
MKGSPFRNTIIAVVILLLLLAAALVLKKVEEQKESGEKKERTITSIKAGAVEKLNIMKGDNTVVTFSRKLLGEGKYDRWWITYPKQMYAASESIDAMITGLLEQQAGRLLKIPEPGEPSKDYLADYGLEKPECTIVFEGSKINQPITISVGKKVPVGSYNYVHSSEKDEIFTVKTYLLAPFEKDLIEFREKRLFPINLPDVLKIELNSGKGQLKCTKEGQKWSLELPYSYPTDKMKIEEDLLNPIAGLNIDHFVADEVQEKDLRKYGLASVTNSIAVEYGTGPDVSKITVEVGKENPEAEKKTYLFIKTNLAGSIYEIEQGKIEKLLNVDPDSLRDRRLFGFDSKEVASLTIKRADQTPVVFSKNEKAKWTEALQDWLRMLSYAEVRNFVIDPWAIKDKKIEDILPTYGLDKPRYQIEIKTDKNETISFSIGKDASPDTIYLRLADGKSVFSASSDIVKDLEKIIKN